MGDIMAGLPGWMTAWYAGGDETGSVGLRCKYCSGVRWGVTYGIVCEGAET